MKYAYVIAAAIIAASPAAACVTDAGCYEEELNAAINNHPSFAPAPPVITPSTPDNDAPSYHYTPQTCVTNYGGGGVAVTSCY